MSSALISAPLSGVERRLLKKVGRRLRAEREAAGLSRRDLADRTGLHSRSIARIERAERRTRERTLGVLASEVASDPQALLAELVSLAGPALADESPFIERIERRRLRRLRRIEVLEARQEYAAHRAAVEVRWAERTESHLRFRAAMRLLDVSFRQLRRLGVL